MGASVSVVATSSIFFRLIGARSGQSIANSGLVALISRGANSEVSSQAEISRASGSSRTQVVVIASASSGLVGSRALSSSRVASSSVLASASSRSGALNRRESLADSTDTEIVNSTRVGIIAGRVVGLLGSRADSSSRIASSSVVALISGLADNRVASLAASSTVALIELSARISVIATKSSSLRGETALSGFRIANSGFFALGSRSASLESTNYAKTVLASRARSAIVSAAARRVVGSVRLRAKTSVGVASTGNLALRSLVANDGVASNTDSILAFVGLSALVSVIASVSVLLRRIEALSSRGIARTGLLAHSRRVASLPSGRLADSSRAVSGGSAEIGNRARSSISSVRLSALAGSRIADSLNVASISRARAGLRRRSNANSIGVTLIDGSARISIVASRVGSHLGVCAKSSARVTRATGVALRRAVANDRSTTANTTSANVVQSALLVVVTRSGVGLVGIGAKSSSSIANSGNMALIRSGTVRLPSSGRAESIEALRDSTASISVIAGVSALDSVFALAVVGVTSSSSLAFTGSRASLDVTSSTNSIGASRRLSARILIVAGVSVRSLVVDASTGLSTSSVVKARVRRSVAKDNGVVGALSSDGTAHRANAGISTIRALKRSEDALSGGNVASIDGTVDVIVALAASLSVSLADSAPIVPGASHFERSEHLEVRSRCVSLGEENVEGISLILLKIGKSCAEDDSLRCRSMDSSKIDNEGVVDVNPNVIISSELENFISHVSERSVKFKSEGEVLVVSVISKPLSVNGEEIVGVESVYSRLAGTIADGIGEDDIVGERNIPSGGVSEPHIETGGLVVDTRVIRSVVVDRLSVLSKESLNDVQVISVISLEIIVALGRITRHCRCAFAAKLRFRAWPEISHSTGELDSSSER